MYSLLKAIKKCTFRFLKMLFKKRFFVVHYIFVFRIHKTSSPNLNKTAQKKVTFRYKDVTRLFYRLKAFLSKNVKYLSRPSPNVFIHE